MKPPTPLEAVIATAAEGLTLGFSILPPKEDGTKAPSCICVDGAWTWIPFQSRQATPVEFSAWYGRHTGVGVVCGAISRGLELFEFDCRETYARFKEAATAVGLAELVADLEAGYLEETPGGGIHWFYFCDEVRGSTKLAMRPGPPDERGRVSFETLIETKGEGGFAIVAPSYGKVHPSGNPYRLISGGLVSIATIDSEERDHLWDLARSFDETAQEETPEPKPPGRDRDRPHEEGLKPGDDFSLRTTWAEILGPAGWVKVASRGEEDYWRRPGKQVGISATTNYRGSGLFFVFTSSSEFEMGKTCTKFGAYARLNHGGNHQAAARELAAKGYGDPSRGSTGPGRKGGAGGHAGGGRVPSAEVHDEEEEWPPLRLWSLPPVEPFPLDVFPAAVARLAAEASTAVGCDVGMVAGSMLAVAGGLIGRSASLLLGSNWFASASLFLANVALPGDGKSPSLAYAYTPVREIDRQLAEEFAREKQDYLDELKAIAKGEKAGPPPIPRRVVVEDTTLEACSRVLAQNARGLVMVLDELAVLLCGLGQYKNGKGNDRANLLKMWAGAPIVIDRVLNEFGEPIRIPHPSLSIVGNCPPVILRQMTGGQGDDGLLDRWLFSYPDRRPKLKSSQRKPVGNETLEGWAEIARRLWDRQMEAREGRSAPHVIFFANEGKVEFDRWDDNHVDEMNHEDFPEHLRGPWSKLQEYAGRLCLILTLMHHAAKPAVAGDVLPLADAQAARDAWRLIAYFKSHHKRVRAYLQGRGIGGTPEYARLVLNWINHHPDRCSFSQRDLARSYPPTRGYDRALMADSLAWLAQRNAIRLESLNEKPEGTPGRKPSPVWGIHPDLLEAQQNQRVQRNAPGQFAEDADSAAHSEEEEGRWSA